MLGKIASYIGLTPSRQVKGGSYCFELEHKETGEEQVLDLYNELFRLDNPDEWHITRKEL